FRVISGKHRQIGTQEYLTENCKFPLSCVKQTRQIKSVRSAPVPAALRTLYKNDFVRLPRDFPTATSRCQLHSCGTIFLRRLRFPRTGEKGRLMKYRRLGRTGIAVSDIGYGLWGMSGWAGSDDRESLASLQLAVDLGCTFFDSAWAYGEGKSDALLGEILARNHSRNPEGKQLFAASKIPPMNDKWPALPQYKYSEVFPAKHVF